MKESLDINTTQILLNALVEKECKVMSAYFRESGEKKIYLRGKLDSLKEVTDFLGDCIEQEDEKINQYYLERYNKNKGK